ncbi:MAG TPA: DUF2971 domain-containing protein [Ohtaekwangia sp.]|nr:DUF2971 domain-containing protein [Ohtaekwangia sp.]
MDSIPKLLYKYRDWSNPFQKRLLTDVEIYLSAPNQFNDPFDAAIPFRYDENDLTPENIFLKYLEVGKREYPKHNETQLHELAFDYQRRNLLFDEHHLEEQNSIMQREFNKQYGILSLCDNKNNFLMWSHYSNSHKGFCVGFDSEKLFEQTTGQIGPVIYQDEFPKFGLFEDLIHQSIKATYTKSSIWAYEKEWRIMKAKISNRIVKLQNETIKEIILGNKMAQSEKFTIIELAAKQFPGAEVYEIKMHKTKFQLELQRVR